MASQVVTTTEAAQLVPDGATIALCGCLSLLEPDAILEEIEARFLQDVGVGIFLPLEVVFSVSEDGRVFREVASVKHEVYGLAVVLNVEPISYIKPISVKRKRLALKSIGYEERDHLFGILVRSKIVGAPSDRYGKMVGDPVGKSQEVTSRLAG